jgi:hypothetical protein
MYKLAEMRERMKNSRKSLIIAGATALVVLIVGLVVWQLQAAGYFSAIEPEQGTVSGNAKIVSDGSASGGLAIQFTAPVLPPPPTGGSDCRPSSTDCRVHWTSRCPAYPAFPNESCTGVPAGVSLTSFGCNGGDYRIDKDTVIDGKIVNCNLYIPGDDAGIHNVHLTIKNSRVIGSVKYDVDPAKASQFTSWVVVVDSEVGHTNTTDGGIGVKNVIVLGTNSHDGPYPINCESYCYAEDNWLHGTYNDPNASNHLDAFLSNGIFYPVCGSATNYTANCYTVQVIHNTLACDSQPNAHEGGCSGDVGLYPDFASISSTKFDKNLFIANSTGNAYCVYGGAGSKTYSAQSHHIVFTNNVFQRGSNNNCGDFGPVSSYNTNLTGNVWTNNTWENGGLVQPDN